MLLGLSAVRVVVWEIENVEFFHSRRLGRSSGARLFGLASNCHYFGNNLLAPRSYFLLSSSAPWWFGQSSLQ
jgi:hypothetical protein